MARLSFVRAFFCRLLNWLSFVVKRFTKLTSFPVSVHSPKQMSISKILSLMVGMCRKQNEVTCNIIDSGLKCTIEWRIKNIFSCMTKCYQSPTFSILGSQWYFIMDPTDDPNKSFPNYVSMQLGIANSLKFPKKATFSLGVKKNDGEINSIGSPETREFTSPSTHTIATFLRRSLLESQKEFIQSGYLTVICTLETTDDFDSVSRLIKLSENFEDMFNSKAFCDGKLKVQRKEFPIHKAVLVSRCPALAAMFQADINKLETGIVEIEDFEPDSFKDFLLYLYSGKFQIPNNVWELYKIANKFSVINLKTDCALFIANNLTVKNVLEAFIFGCDYNENILTSIAQAFFNCNYSDILTTDEWALFNKENNTLATQLLKNMGENVPKFENYIKQLINQLDFSFTRHLLSSLIAQTRSRKIVSKTHIDKRIVSEMHIY